MSSSFCRGTMAVTRTTRSTGMSSSAPAVSRSRTVTRSPPPSRRATVGGASSANLRYDRAPLARLRRRASRTCRRCACPGRGGTGGPGCRVRTARWKRAPSPCSSSGSSIPVPRRSPAAAGCRHSRCRRRCRTGRPSCISAPVGAVDQLLELGQRQDPVDAVAVLPCLGPVGVDAGGDDDRPDLDGELLGFGAADARCRPGSCRRCRPC